MSELLKDRLKKWRGRRYYKEVAAIFEIPVGTYRAWEKGKRSPKLLTLCEVERRMETNPDMTP